MAFKYIKLNQALRSPKFQQRDEAEIHKYIYEKKKAQEKEIKQSGAIIKMMAK